MQDLVSLKDSDRRSMLRVLAEEKYDEVMAVLGSFPHITMDIKLQGGSCDTLVRWINVLQHPLPGLSLFAVLDDEDSNNITAGSIVTVTVTLTRKRMAVSKGGTGNVVNTGTGNHCNSPIGR